MQFIKPDVATICCGVAMSMGSLLLTGGAKGKRFSLPNAGSSSTSRRPASRASRRTSRSTRAEILKTRKRVDEIYAHHTGQTEEQVHVDMERDRFFKPDQAAEYGLIDKVIEHALVAAEVRHRLQRSSGSTSTSSRLDSSARTAVDGLAPAIARRGAARRCAAVEVVRLAPT